MSTVKTFHEYHSLREENTDSALAPKAKKVTIDGKEYTAVPSTYKSIGMKQKDMGEEAVGVLTLPNEKEVYELLLVESEKLAGGSRKDKAEPAKKEEKK
jgi:hypothetical protein